MDRASNELFASVVDAAPDGMLIIDSEGTVEFANIQAGRLFGAPRNDLVGRSVDDLLPAQLRQVHRAHRLRYKADPKVRPMGTNLLLRAVRDDGAEVPVEVSLSPLQTDEGLYVVAAVRDVTGRVEAEENMRRVLRTLDATEDAMFILDADTLRFSYVNQGAARQVGYTRDELIGMTPMHINPELSEADLRKAVDSVRDDDQAAMSLRTVHRKSDGTDIPVEMSLQGAPRTRDGSVSMIALARDISGRLAAEAQMRRSEQALREAEQVMAIADDRERIARDLHDTVIQRLFASGLALQAVMLRVEPELVERIERIVDDLDQTIREIRTSIFALQASSAAEQMGLRGKILQVASAASDALGFEPRLQFEGPVETIDEEIAEQLLPTLREALTNVAKHAEARSVRVVVKVDDDVSLVVLDDGVGVAEEAPDAGAESTGGHGLRNMRTRAADLGGSVLVEGVEPGGTRVIWRVPAAGPPEGVSRLDDAETSPSLPAPPGSQEQDRSPNPSLN